MNDQEHRIQGDGRLFRQCIQDCARDERIVAAYNKLYGTKLRAPLSELVNHKEGTPGPNPETEEGAQLAGFIMFCYLTVWRYVRRAQKRTTWRIRLTST